MNKFIFKLVLFLIPIFSISVLGLLLPPTPRASTSLLLSYIQKDKLLKTKESPRMIFVGGSNLSFGLNSQMIKDELNINPINTGVHANIGLQYMLNNTIQYIKAGDVVVLAPEYHIFFRDYHSTSEELFRSVFDVNPSKVQLLSIQQAIRLIPYVTKYLITKISPTEYFNITENKIYGVNSFNEYGDTYTHWDLENEEFIPMYRIGTPFDRKAIIGIVRFKEAIERKKAKLFVTYPGLQDISYMYNVETIQKIENEYKKHDLQTLGYPERYKIPNDMMFNTPYHLNKKGVDRRTRLLIDDYKKTALYQSQKLVNLNR